MAFKAFLHGKLPSVTLHVGKEPSVWTPQQMKVLQYLHGGDPALVQEGVSERWLNAQVRLNGAELPATTAELLAAPGSTPSSFGDLANGRTVVDAAVRNSLEFTDVSLSEALVSKLQQVFERVFSISGCTVECYKLCVYGKGVGFQWHQDTPLPDMVGTVVLKLHTNEYRTGGELELVFAGKTITAEAPITVFLPSLLHRVTPLQHGHRVSVLCRVYRHKAADTAADTVGEKAAGQPSAKTPDTVATSEPGAAASTPATGDLTEWLSTVVDDDPFPQDFAERNEYGSGDWPDGPRYRYGWTEKRTVVNRVYNANTTQLAVQAMLRTTRLPRRIFLMTQHCYSASQLQHVDTPADMLLGRDRTLYTALATNAAVKVWVTPAVCVRERLEEDNNNSHKHWLGYMDDGLIRAALDGGSGITCATPQRPHLAALFVPDDRVDMVAHQGNTERSNCLRLYEEIEPMVYTGNETGMGIENCLYYAAAIVVQLADTPVLDAAVVHAQVKAARAAHAARRRRR